MTTVAAPRPAFDWRIPILAALIAALCAVFWLDSRYPSLQGKASADPDEALATPLGFEKHWPEPGAHEPVKHVLWSAAEWAITNKQGMTFGLLLAAGLLTLVPLVPAARGGRHAGALQGALIGTPLGVCVNCAAPIGQAMLKGGARVEVALATMFASPSFNVIVVGILLSLFPFYLVALKVVASLLMVLVVVPQLAKLSERPGWRKPLIVAPAKLPGLKLFQWLERGFDRAHGALLRKGDDAPRGFVRAMGWVVLRYPRNLWVVIKLALPLMLLAGLIGAALAELLPWGRLASMSHVDGLLLNALALAAVTLFGTLLPVPMAFDVIVCAVLWDAGVPPQFVAALLVTLGIYSVYPASLLGTTLSWRMAAAAGGAVFALGLLAGGAAALLHGWHELRLARQVAAILEASGPPPAPALLLPPGRHATELLAAITPPPAAQPVARAGDVELLRAAFLPAAAGAEPAFQRVEGASLGFERLPLPRAYRIMEPSIMHLGPLAAGDINRDGWPDVAVGTAFGVFVYVNTGGRFALQALDWPGQRDWQVTALALADLDGDRAPELVACGWMQGCRVLFNRNGGYSDSAATTLPSGSELSVQSLAFADVDRDGDVDLVTGAASYVPRFFYPATSINKLWRNDGKGGFAPEALVGPEGETLTLLFHDFNADGWPDLYAGNDFDEPDRIYLNQRGTLAPAAGLLPRTTYDTMSADAGDLDNDGREELYLGGIAMGSPGAGFAARVATPLPSCASYTDLADRARCDAVARFQLATFGAYSVQSMAPCKQLADAAERRDCAVSAYHWNRVLARLPALGADKARVLEECERVPADFATLRDICAAIALSPMDHEDSERAFPEEMPQLRQTNLLYRAGDAGFDDVTSKWQAGVGGWTWNARFADLDNDGWQDLFITQGTRLRPNSPSALYYRNRGGAGFEERARASGLEDHNPTGAALFIDHDLDGDLDLLTQPFLLSPVAWRNQAPAGAGLEIALDDRRSGNRDALGARVELRAADGKRQFRSIRASGGYQSHNPPVARFGLGKAGSAASLRVTWPDGAVTDLDGLQLGPGRYTLVRSAHPE
ncbi:MAG TPA: FG-GAP-like repeat-containing protein [Verrucomicrobiae bacterium]|nr:FG-GAP-like repeat-containing protein [Verrucomicrobiae bacterium]